MKSKSIFAIACLLAVPLLAQESVTFGSPTVAAGDSWQETSSYGTNIEVAVDNGMGIGNPHNVPQDLPALKQKSSVSRTKTITVTSIKGIKIGGVRVTYSAVEVDDVDMTSAFAGKIYEVDLNGNKVATITYGDGTAVPESELAFVTRDNSNVAQVRELRRTFGGETVSAGDVLRAKNPEDLFDLQGGLEIDDFKMTAKSFSGSGADQVAVFDVSLIIKGTGAKKGKNATSDAAPFSTNSMQFKLEGELTAFVATARIRDFDFSGPAVVTGAKESKGKDKHGAEVTGKKGPGGSQSRSMSINATGTASLKADFSY